MKKHSVLSASGSDRWLNCPGSVKLSEGIETIDNEYSINGTYAHELLELTLANQDTDDFKFTDEMRGAVNFTSNFILNRQAELGAELFSERKVSLSFINPKMFGTLDMSLISEFNTLEIYDFKFGTHPIKTQNGMGLYDHNTQLIYYALALAHEYNYNFLTCRIGIIQPRNKWRKVTTSDLSIDTLKGYKEIFEKGVKRVYEKKPKLSTGSWCKWCPAFQVCPKQDAINIKKLGDAFEGI